MLSSSLSLFLCFSESMKRFAEKRTLDNIGSSLLDKKSFDKVARTPPSGPAVRRRLGSSIAEKRALDHIGSSLLDKKSLDHIGSSLPEKRELDSIARSLIVKRTLDKIGSSLMRKRAHSEE